MENRAGVTRDAVEIDWKYGEREIKLVDTAGMRRWGSVSSAYFPFPLLNASSCDDETHAELFLVGLGLTIRSGVGRSCKEVVGHG